MSRLDEEIRKLVNDLSGYAFEVTEVAKSCVKEVRKISQATKMSTHGIMKKILSKFYMLPKPVREYVLLTYMKLLKSYVEAMRGE